MHIKIEITGIKIEFSGESIPARLPLIGDMLAQMSASPTPTPTQPAPLPLPSPLPPSSPPSSPVPVRGGTTSIPPATHAGERPAAARGPASSSRQRRAGPKGSPVNAGRKLPPPRFLVRNVAGGPSVSPSEMAEKLGVSISAIYWGIKHGRPVKGQRLARVDQADKHQAHPAGNPDAVPINPMRLIAATASSGHASRITHQK